MWMTALTTTQWGKWRRHNVCFFTLCVCVWFFTGWFNVYLIRLSTGERVGLLNTELVMSVRAERVCVICLLLRDAGLGAEYWMCSSFINTIKWVTKPTDRETEKDRKTKGKMQTQSTAITVFVDSDILFSIHSRNCALEFRWLTVNVPPPFPDKSSRLCAGYTACDNVQCLSQSVSRGTETQTTISYSNRYNSNLLKHWPCLKLTF
jgi:hypothetical protein